jgi:aspartyl/glutamyl-tRNA(Asn/Gln) amidotransferase subunit B (EC 6.3.5.-)
MRPEYIGEVQELLNNGVITRTSAKEAFEAAFREGRSPAVIVAERGLAVIGAGDALTDLVRQVIAGNPKVVEEYRRGKATAIKYLIGQVMKATRGQANPQAVQQALEQELAREQAAC